MTKLRFFDLGDSDFSYVIAAPNLPTAIRYAQEQVLEADFSDTNEDEFYIKEVPFDDIRYEEVFDPDNINSPTERVEKAFKKELKKGDPFIVICRGEY